MNKQKHKERTERIQETGGKLRGGTVGNVWEWGPQGSREDSLMEMEEEVFDAHMDHMESITRYEARLEKCKKETQDIASAGSAMKELLNGEVLEYLLSAKKDDTVNKVNDIIRTWETIRSK